jgi:hypothetical protein
MVIKTGSAARAPLPHHFHHFHYFHYFHHLLKLDSTKHDHQRFPSDSRHLVWRFRHPFVAIVA